MIKIFVFINEIFLRSQDPASWAWGLHPDQGLDYKAKDSLSVEVKMKTLY